jgi:predicted signal transduction protein with EAL and GGDEF domain
VAGEDSLIQVMPDMVAFVRPDGLITHHLGGRRVPFLRNGTGLGNGGRLADSRLEDVLPAELAQLVLRLVRRAIAVREECQADFAVDAALYQVRATPQGPQRVLCILRQLDARADPGVAPEAGILAGRRSFMQRLQRSIADAALRERPLALCIVHLDGMADIGRLLDFALGERILTQTLAQLPQQREGADGDAWYVGEIGDALLGAVIEGTTERGRIEAIAASLCQAIARPIRVEDATFHLAPAAGIAMLGDDAARPAALFDHARAAMLEARRGGSGSIQFYSDTLRMLPVARLDIERELRRAVAEGQIGLRYRARHELDGGRIAGIQAYLRWTHPLRGEIPPADFLPIADATGLAASISRYALERLARDLDGLGRHYGPAVSVSFGALRQHLSSGELLEDCRRLAAGVPGFLQRLELRISESALATLNEPERMFTQLAGAGARLVLDEMGRGVSSLAQLPRLPLAALQIDRVLVVDALRCAAALATCRAIGSVAGALGIVAVAAGVDDEATRLRMLQAGCSEGLGDLYPSVAALGKRLQIVEMANRQAPIDRQHRNQHQRLELGVQFSEPVPSHNPSQKLTCRERGKEEGSDI